MSESVIADLHCHILPEMDDGSRSPEMSLQMLQMLAGQKVDTVCLTSHYYADRESIDTFCARRLDAFRRLRIPEEIARTVLGAEVAFFPGISKCRELDPLCLAGTNTLLLEMPFCDWNQFQIDEIVSLVLDRDYRVVLVHPERFLFNRKHMGYLERLAEMGLPFQINADTLRHLLSRKDGLALLQLTDYPLLGTDCHNLTSRKPCMDEARRIVQRKLGADFLELIDESAASVLQ